MTPSAQKKAEAARTRIAAEVFLESLSAHGVDYCFTNPGTDFPPIVEAFLRARRGNTKVPEPILVPHENLAVAMAHGVYLMTGRPQAVMVHVNVGTANTVNNIANLARDRAPVIVAAGRTPITEKGQFGSRTRPIHWAQEMFDQAGMVRELVKWDYELRMPEQIGDVTARAYEMAMTSPRGPVYLVLPREPLSAPLPDYQPEKLRALPAPPSPDPHAIATLAEWLAAAERPVILNAAAGDPKAVDILGRIAGDYAIPVVAHFPRVMALPASHPLHFGYDSAAMLAEADIAVVIECDVPYYPHLTQPAADCRFVHIGEDTVYQRYPMRSFPTDLAITANATRALEALEAALAKHKTAMQARIDARRGPLVERARTRRAKAATTMQASDRITPEFLSRMIGEVLGEDAVIFNEYPLRLEHCPREKPGTFFAASPAGGLGWGLGAALGAKLAAPDKLIVATLGDGVYLFTNPTVSHWVGEKYRLPVLTIIFNNQRYGAVRNATLSMFKDGLSGEDDGRFLADLDPSAPYDELMRAQGGFGERVEKPQDLAGALARARDAVMKDKKQALLNVICPY
jgi:acetolactate synthase I/II/III large subunit